MVQNILVSILVLLISTSVSAFTLRLDPLQRGYENPEVTFLINQASCPAGLNLRQLVEDATEMWNRVSTSKLVVKVGGSSTHSNLASGTYPPTAFCAATGITGNTLGLGGSSMYVVSKRLAAGMLALNTDAGQPGYVMNQSYDRLVIVAAHEIGHVLGLGHSANEFALMHWNIGSKVDPNLSQDDIDGITYLYPRDELSGDTLFGGCGIVKGLPPPSGPSNGMLLFVLLMPLAVWSRLRRFRFIKVS